MQIMAVVHFALKTTIDACRFEYFNFFLSATTFARAFKIPLKLMSMSTSQGQLLFLRLTLPGQQVSFCVKFRQHFELTPRDEDSRNERSKTPGRTVWHTRYGVWTWHNKIWISVTFTSQMLLFCNIRSRQKNTIDLLHLWMWFDIYVRA
jgi:hypothetical protein